MPRDLFTLFAGEVMSFKKTRRPPRLSHRARLTVITAAFAGLLLLVLFVLAGYGFYLNERNGAENEMAPAVLEAAAEYGQNKLEPDLNEIVQANADLSLAIFGRNGQRITQRGNIVDLPRNIPDGQTEVSGLPVIVKNRQFRDITVVAAVGWRSRERALTRFVTNLVVLWPGLVMLIAVTTWFSSRSTFEPLERLARQAEAFSTANLHERLDVEHGEYGEFAERLNRFLDRLEQSVRREERFVSDAAHELRTPLTVMQGRLETALLRTRSEATYRDTLKEVLSETERLAGLVEVLLQSATLVQGEVPSLDIQEQVERAHARWVDRFALQSVELKLVSSECFGRIKAREFESIIDNLLSNALKASPPGSTCHLKAEGWESGAKVEVIDEGSGVPPDKAESIFERLTRLDEGRTRDAGGFGIGLSVCRRIVEGRGGSVYLVGSKQGAHFVVRLPR